MSTQSCEPQPAGRLHMPGDISEVLVLSQVFETRQNGLLEIIPLETELFHTCHA